MLSHLLMSSHCVRLVGFWQTCCVSLVEHFHCFTHLLISRLLCATDRSVGQDSSALAWKIGNMFVISFPTSSESRPFDYRRPHTVTPPPKQHKRLKESQSAVKRIKPGLQSSHIIHRAFFAIGTWFLGPILMAQTHCGNALQREKKRRDWKCRDDAVGQQQRCENWEKIRIIHVIPYYEQVKMGAAG